MLKKALLVVVLLLLGLSWATGVSAQESTASAQLSVWTTGQINPADNQVFYSVLMTSGATALTDVTISAALPEGATFVKDFWKPEAAEFVGAADGAVSWKLAAVDANVVAGPFTFVVSFENAASNTFAPPAQFKASVISSAGTAENEVIEGVLPQLETAGALDVTPEGMLDFTAVGNTGLWLYVPAKAVSGPVTLNFQRNAMSEPASVPQGAEKTWWCGSVSITASAEAALSGQVILVVPLLRASTPGTVLPVFGKQGDGEWTLLSVEDALTSKFDAATAYNAAAFAAVAPTGTEAYIVLNGAQVGATPMTLAVGIDTTVRIVSVAPVEPKVVTTIKPPRAAWQQDEWF